MGLTVDVPSFKLLMEISLLTFCPNINVYIRESENSNTRGKVVSERALNLEKSYWNAYAFVGKKKMLFILSFGLMYFFKLLVGRCVHSRLFAF